MNIATKLRPAKSRLNRGLNVLGLDDITKQPYINGLPRKSDEAIAFQIHQAVEVGDGDRSKLDKALDEAQRQRWLVIDMKRDWQRIFIADEDAR